MKEYTLENLKLEELEELNLPDDLLGEMKLEGDQDGQLGEMKLPDDK